MTQRKSRVFIHLTILIFITYGLIWLITQKIYDWIFDTGAEGILPHGYSAMWLSLSLTIPVLVIPAIYQVITGDLIIQKGHLIAGTTMVAINILTNLLLYGVSEYNGTVNLLVPLREILDKVIVYPASHIFKMQTLNELVNAFVNVGMTIFSYHIVIRLKNGEYSLVNGTMLVTVLIGCFITFLPIELYVLIKYPDSLIDSKWINVRGIVASVSMSAAYAYTLYPPVSAT
ncbi:MAG: hypothetical protein RLZ75_3125 [Pseudomonadota bacterium]|jgi:hypothetical protein